MPRMRLTSVMANQHVYDGCVNGRPIRLLLNFDDGRSLRLAVAGDGFGMVADALPLDEPFDMDECGSVVVVDVTQSLFPRLRGADVIEVSSLRLEGQQVGVNLRICGGGDTHFWVDGDELFWGDDKALSAHEWLDGVAPAAAERVQV
ncbi:MAG: hypothetical protein ABI454_02935 [Sphingomicrobium sp.]